MPKRVATDDNNAKAIDAVLSVLEGFSSKQISEIMAYVMCDVFNDAPSPFYAPIALTHHINLLTTLVKEDMASNGLSLG